MLISKAIPCTDKPLTLKVWYWKAAFIPQIRVCYKFFNESTVAQCSAEVNGFQPPDWLPLTATIPPINRQFQVGCRLAGLLAIQLTTMFDLQIVIQSIRLFQAVAIDDISLEGDLTCTGRPALAAIGKPAPAVNASSPKDVTLAPSGTKKVLCSP